LTILCILLINFHDGVFIAKRAELKGSDQLITERC